MGDNAVFLYNLLWWIICIKLAPFKEMKNAFRVTFYQSTCYHPQGFGLT